ncbi:DinB family protein [Tunturiibacter empetritectus]|uniref:DinB-like domain-containing protein n=1 Tax=Tunturiibacter lichenicola TaxID=2051959 RepID=A0A852VIX8_9BACT|nr:DinB family protein [Edaphobacter lichenicola]NYF91570.1 hypothetical protein [Edaphobacter lichenicola]
MIEQQKRELIDELSHWASERLAFRPTSNEWSALQMVDHLIRTEREILLVTYSNEHQLHRIGLIDHLRTRFLEGLFRSDRKVKVPSTASVVLPGIDVQLPILTAEWLEVRAKLAQNVDRLLAGPHGMALFHHPVGGWMSMQAVLNFLSVHLVHHRFQLQRLRAASVHLQPLDVSPFSQ